MGDSFDQQEDREEVLYNQWRNFYASNQWDRAIEILHELLSLDPEADWVLGQLGWAHQYLNKLDEAESFFQKAIRLNPDDSGYFEGLAWVYWRRNKIRRAEDSCRKAIELDPDDPDPWFLMARIMVRLDDPESAQKFLDGARKIAPADSRALEIQTDIGGLEDAPNKLSPLEQLENHRQMLAQNPNSAFHHYRIGFLHLEDLKNPREAEEHFRTALSLNPEDTDYQVALMKAIRKRDWFLRFLWFPANLGMWILEKYSNLWDMKWPIVFLIFTWWAFIFPAAALLICFAIFFWPMAKIYEVCTLADIHRKMGRISLYSGPMARIHSLPFQIRITIFLSVFLLFWGGVIVAMQDREVLAWTLAILGTVVVFAVRIFIILGLIYWIWSAISKRRRRKRNSHL